MPVIIQSGWTKGRGRYAQPQRHHGASQSQFAGRISAIFGADSFARVQGYGGCQTTTGHRTPIESAAALRSVIADVSSLVGVFAGVCCVIALPRLFHSFGLLARWSFPLRVQPAKQSRGGFTKCFDLSFPDVFHSGETSRKERRSVVRA